MDNHQLELASQLAEDGHLSYATCGYVISSFMIWSASFSAENRSLWLQLEVDRLINVVNFLLSQEQRKILNSNVFVGTKKPLVLSYRTSNLLVRCSTNIGITESSFVDYIRSYWYNILVYPWQSAKWNTSWVVQNRY